MILSGAQSKAGHVQLLTCCCLVASVVMGPSFLSVISLQYMLLHVIEWQLVNINKSPAKETVI